MAQGGELSPALEAVKQFAVARPEFGADGLGLRRDGVVRPTQVSFLGHTPSRGADGKYPPPEFGTERWAAARFRGSTAAAYRTAPTAA